MSKRPKHYMNAYRHALLTKVTELNEQVFTRAELTDDFTNKGQLKLNRALRFLVDEGYIIKICHGLYAKAMKVQFPDGDTKVILQDSFENIAMQALNKLGVKWEIGRAIQEYNHGETTQVPAVFSVRLHSRFRGTISAEGRSIIFEDNKNAR